MKKINENNYISYTIAAPGFNFTVFDFKKAQKEWAGFSSGTLWGTKLDGTREILDTKE